MNTKGTPSSPLRFGARFVPLVFVAGALAQPVDPPRLSGVVNVVKSDYRPDSGAGYLIGLRQGDTPPTLDLARLAGLLPPRDKSMEVCLRARNRAGTYRAEGLLKAPAGDEHELAVRARNFPSDDSKEFPASDFAALYVDAPCQGKNARFYPASFGMGQGRTLTAMFNLPQPREAPSSRLEYGDRLAKRSSIKGSCRQLRGSSRAYNVICDFGLGARFAGQSVTLIVDYEPERGPANTFDVRVWVAPSQ